MFRAALVNLSEKLRLHVEGKTTRMQVPACAVYVDCHVISVLRRAWLEI